MVKIYDAGVKFKKDEASALKEHFLLDLKSKEAANPDAKIPFVALKNIFLRPNIDEGKFEIQCLFFYLELNLKYHHMKAILMMM